MKKTNQKTLEEIIRVDHAVERGTIKIYEGQLLTLKTIKQDDDLKEKIEKFKVSEVDHKNIAYESGDTNRGLYSIMDKVIRTGSRIAITVSEKI
tara:strand:- start:199 stop:480 length:282 start_codon:yes stop_codon:yes gene_type:complete